MNFKKITFTALLTAFLVLPTTLLAYTQIQTTSTDGHTSGASYFGGKETGIQQQYSGMRFKANATGTVDTVSVLLQEENSTHYSRDMVMEIVNTEDRVVLGTSSPISSDILLGTATTSPIAVPFTFPTPVNLVQGTLYDIVLTTPVGVDCTVFACYDLYTFVACDAGDELDGDLDTYVWTYTPEKRYINFSTAHPSDDLYMHFACHSDGWFIISGATTTPPCVTDCNSNVLFLPGIEGSRLYEPLVCNYHQQGVCQTEQLWEPQGDALALRLGHDVNGSSTNPGIYTHDIIDNAYVPLQGNIYKSFIEDMNAMQEKGTIREWEAIPYDWRLSPDQILSSGKVIYDGAGISYLKATSSPFIIQELHRLATSSKTGKVTIIAHSNGGLVTKRLTEILGTTTASQLIDKIIFVAVPQVGTPKAIGSILHGFDQGIGSFFIGGDKITETTARIIAKNMPIAYNLLPSANYFTYVDDSVVTFTDEPLVAPLRARYGDIIHSAERLHSFVTDTLREASSTDANLKYPSVGNESLLTNAEELHTDIDHWTPPSDVQLYEIAGWGKDTPGTIEYYQGKETFCTVPGDLYTCTDVPAVFYGVKTVLDGDGTVVVPSALWTATSTGVMKYWVNLKKYGESGLFSSTINRKHADILEVDPLRKFLQDIIKNKSLEDLSSYTYISTSTPINIATSTQLHFTLHSPLSLDLYDNLGNHTGISTTTGMLEENIPASDYETFGELKYITVPVSVSPKLILNGYASGSFTLDVKEMQGEIITASTTFSGIPSATTTRVTMDFTDGTIANAGALKVDEDGNGTTDFALTPKAGEVITLPAVPIDITPPEVQITFSTSTNAISIIGIDESGTTTISSTTTYPILKKNQKQYNGIATTTVTIKDQAGNTTQLQYTELLPSPAKRDTINLTTISYNGAVQNLGTTTLKYKWANNKTTGAYTMFASTFSTSTVVIESHYRPKKNVTLIMNTPIDIDDSDVDDDADVRLVKTKLSGFVVPIVTTSHGKITVNY